MVLSQTGATGKLLRYKSTECVTVKTNPLKLLNMDIASETLLMDISDHKSQPFVGELCLN